MADQDVPYDAGVPSPNGVRGPTGEPTQDIVHRQEMNESPKDVDSARGNDPIVRLGVEGGEWRYPKAPIRGGN